MAGVKGRSGNPEAYKYGFGSRPREVDDEYRSRQKGVPHKRVWTKERCTEVLDELLSHLNKILKEDKKLEDDNPKKLKQEHVRDAITLINKILDVMRYMFPPIQQSVNVNVDATTDDVIERLKEWKKKKVFVIGKENAQE